MSTSVEWIAAQAEAPLPLSVAVKERTQHKTAHGSAGCQSNETLLSELPAHNFPQHTSNSKNYCEYKAGGHNPDLWLYRDRTVGLLRRYLRFSIETGRLPSLVGREFFRAKVSGYQAVTFEDRIIFVHDVEKCIKKLEEWDQELIARAVLQEHTQEQTARILRCSRRTVQRRIAQVLDQLSEQFLRVGLLVELPASGR